MPLDDSKRVVLPDGTVVAEDGAVILAADHPDNPGDLTIDSVGNAVSASSGDVIIASEGFQLTATIHGVPTTPGEEEEPPEEGEKEDSGTEETLWRALSLQRVSGGPVAVRRNRKHRRRSPAPSEDDEGIVFV